MEVDAPAGAAGAASSSSAAAAAVEAKPGEAELKVKQACERAAKMGGGDL